MKKRLFLEAACDGKIEQDKYGPNLLFISRLYTRFIEDVDIIDLRKIAVRIIDRRRMESIMPVLKITKVCSIEKHFDWTDYDKENLENNRYRIILDFISASVLEAAEKFNWPKQPFETAYKKVIEAEFKNEFTILNSKPSKNKRYLASITAKGTAQFITLFIHIEDNESVKGSYIEFIKLVYHMDDFSRVANSLTWLNDHEVLISSKDKEINFKVDTDSKEVKVILAPLTHNENYLQEELKIMLADTPKEERIEITQSRIIGK